ncbi:MAG TPA: hypothetical protein VGA37_05755 [Gemmatimonadales bacterium]
MARPGPATIAKRQREIAKQQKKKAKAEKRAARKEQKEQDTGEQGETGQDPDLIGIVPGPQPPLY